MRLVLDRVRKEGERKRLPREKRARLARRQGTEEGKRDQQEEKRQRRKPEGANRRRDEACSCWLASWGATADATSCLKSH